MISNFKDDLNTGLGLLIDDQCNENLATFEKGKLKTKPKLVDDFKDPQYNKLKSFYNEIQKDYNDDIIKTKIAPYNK